MIHIIVNRDTGNEVARYATIAEALKHLESFPNDMLIKDQVGLARARKVIKRMATGEKGAA